MQIRYFSFTYIYSQLIKYAIYILISIAKKLLKITTTEPVAQLACYLTLAATKPAAKFLIIALTEPVTAMLTLAVTELGLILINKRCKTTSIMAYA